MKKWFEESLVRKYYFIYTFVFIALALSVFACVLVSGRTFVESADGFYQHLQAYIYYGNYIRTIIKNVFVNHQLVIPQWDFAIGEGSDIISTLSYYVIYEPLAVFSAFVSDEKMYVFYSVLQIVRLYLAGAFFSYLCFYKRNLKILSVLVGTLVYVFCAWSIKSVVGHPMFLHPLVYFPLVVTGVEKIINKEKPYLFIISICLTICNFYFFYMIALFTALYVAIRLLLLYHTDFPSMIPVVARLFGSVVIAVLITAFLSFPIAYAYLSSGGRTCSVAHVLFYSWRYYAGLPFIFMTPAEANWLYCGFAMPCLLAVFLLFVRKGSALLRTCFLVCVLVSLSPLLGSMTNGFLYATNRWCWVFALVCSYIVVIQWESLSDLSKIVRVGIWGSAILMFVLSFMIHDSDFWFVRAAAFQLVLLSLFVSIKDIQRKTVSLLFVCVSILINTFFFFSAHGDGYLYEYCASKERISRLFNNEASDIKQAHESLGDTDFSRYSSNSYDMIPNVGMNQHLSSINYYWSLVNPNIVEYRNSLENIKGHDLFSYYGHDQRAALESLANTAYYYQKEDNKLPLPYGFDQTKIPTVYKNKNSLPFAYTYKNIIRRSEWDKLNAIQKQEAMLEYVVIEDESVSDKNIPLSAFKGSCRQVPYSVSSCDGAFIQGNSFVSHKENSSLILEINDSDTAHAELYACLKCLDFKNFSKKDELPGSVGIYFSTPYSSKELSYATPKFNWYADRHDFSINLNYSEANINQIIIRFSHEGIYSFEGFSLVCQPMGKFQQQISALKKDSLQQVEFKPNLVCGRISLAEAKILLLTIPYAKGWKAKVNGRPAKLMRANVMHMALDLDEGDYDIELRYSTPFLTAGIIVSCLSVSLLIAIYIFVTVKKRNQLK